MHLSSKWKSMCLFFVIIVHSSMCMCMHIYLRIYGYKHIKKGWTHSNLFLDAYVADKSIENQMAVSCNSIFLLMKSKTKQVCTLFNLIVNENVSLSPCFILNYIITTNDHSTCDSKGERPDFIFIYV